MKEKRRRGERRGIVHTAILSSENTDYLGAFVGELIVRRRKREKIWGKKRKRLHASRNENVTSFRLARPLF